VIWIVSQGQTSYWLPRYLLFSLPAWALLAGAGLATPRRATKALAGLLALAVVGVPARRTCARSARMTGGTSRPRRPPPRSATPGRRRSSPRATDLATESSRSATASRTSCWTPDCATTCPRGAAS